MDGIPSLPPVEAPDFLPFLALVGLVWGQLEARLLPAAPIRLLAAFALLWPMTASLRQYTWQGSEPVQWVGGLSLGIAALWTLCVAGAQRTPPRSAAVALAAVVGLAAIGLGLSGSARYGQLAGALAAAVSGSALVCLWRPGRREVLAGIPPIALVLGALLSAGVLFSDLPLTSAGLLALSPAGMLLGKRGRGLAGPVLTVLIALGAIVPLAAEGLSATPSSSGY